MMITPILFMLNHQHCMRIFGDNGYLYPNSGKLTAEKILSKVIYRLHTKKNSFANLISSS